MKFKNETFISNDGILWEGVLREVKRAKIALQPVFECFTNALEAIKIREKSDVTFTPSIIITIRSTQSTDSSFNFSSLSIQDNGIGFNDEEFNRFNRYKDFTKGYKNLGSGRIQYAHYFNRTRFRSCYRTDYGNFVREFIVSKEQNFLEKNAIVYHKSNEKTEAKELGTLVIFDGLIDQTRRIYHDITAESLKKSLLERYLHYFCLNKETLPEIKIKHYVFEELVDECRIENTDIPTIDKYTSILVNYSSLAIDGKSIIKLDKSEEFVINSYKLPSAELAENKIALTSKNEIIENVEINLDLLSRTEELRGNRYMFLITSSYIDDRDSDERGTLKIPTIESFSNPELFSEDEILLDEIQRLVNESIVKLYPEIQVVKEQHESDIERLKNMFLLNDEDFNFKISVNDTEKKILEKIYSNEAKKVAEIDAKIKEKIDNLENLKPTDKDYLDKLNKEASELVKVIPQQNKIALTHYVARRKLVLELFDKILSKQLVAQKDGSRNDDEKLLHNLIFQQSNKTPDSSDLWLLNEDFIHFKGTSESKLKDIVVNGIKVLKEDSEFTDNERDFINSLEEDRTTKRPDILLFPDEGKCIIIELKNPTVNASKHLTQINNYATLLRNLCKPEFDFTTFYGYLIGEKINAIDIKSHDGDFVDAYHYDYMYRNHKTIPDLFNYGKAPGSLYTEVIKYSTLLERAKKRNEKFIEKLTNKIEESDLVDETEIPPNATPKQIEELILPIK